MKICINSRDELRLIDMDSVVYLKASGNYSDFFYANGYVRTELSCLSDFEQLITSAFPAGTSPFIRLGRSLLVNIGYVASVNVNKQQLSFSVVPLSPVRLPRAVARDLKQFLSGKYELGNSDIKAL